MELIVATGSFLSSPGISSWGTLHGETAHASLGLAKGLRALGHRTLLVAPLDEELAQSGLGLARRLSPLTFDVGGQVRERIVFDVKLPSGVELVLLGGESPREAQDPLELARRWAWFGHAVAALARHRLGMVRSGGEADLDAVISVGEAAAFAAMAIREVSHSTAHDNGPSPKLLAGLSRVVIPIDPSHDHRLPRTAMSSIGLAESLFSPEGVEFYGEISLTKAGAIGADRVIALGESPRASLSKPGASHRLDGVYRARGVDVLSIGSGIDQAQYNPATDPQLVMRYDPEDLTNKARARSSVLTELELETSTGLPLLVVMGPIDPSAEVALAAAVDRALRGELLVAAVSAAPKSDVSSLDKLARTHKGRIAVRSSATETFLHRALAAADFALVLDEKSATGTAPRAAMRYGTLPIAPRSPAMEEAIVDVEASLATGTGFLASSASESDLFGVIQRAVSSFDRPGFPKLRRRAMRMEGGWERAARRLASILEALEA
ncbi:MAG: hypothetical protein ACXVEE_28930 [Polyangiales bacterium]